MNQRNQTKSTKRAPRITKSRLLAHQILVRVASEGAFADRVLDTAIERADLDDRDVRLVTELVYGTLRQQQRLDFFLNKLMKTPMIKLPTATAVALRLGAYQLLDLRVADHSAVNEAVALVRMYHHYQAGFVNAVLRELARRRDADNLQISDVQNVDPIATLAIKYSQPEWILQRVVKQLGEQDAQKFAAANNLAPPITIRINSLKASTEQVLKDLQALNAQVEFVGQVPNALNIRNVGAPAKLSHFIKGNITVQDAAAQLVAHFAAPSENSVIVDMCAAPGGKTTHLAELINDSGLIIALDIHPGKLRLIQQAAKRLQLKSIIIKAADSANHAVLLQAVQFAISEANAKSSKSSTKQFATPPNLVILDAPCSGSGTLRRNPELRQRHENSLKELTALQDQLLDAGASLLTSGGVLVYAVCSITEEEGPERIKAFLQRHPEFMVSKTSLHTASWLHPYLAPFADGEVLQTWPHYHGMDGFFAARLVCG
ncbi:MAG: 16S rRNA (cytosine(967)-C(5))-methyltransferase RsmB [Deltaproteobacteria bacterium]|nr:16S rRNA (cytosine(967)-C(5))-methyltransferase RsmB [Deltaproteobacteria bacterium]